MKETNTQVLDMENIFGEEELEVPAAGPVIELRPEPSNYDRVTAGVKQISKSVFAEIVD